MNRIIKAVFWVILATVGQVSAQPMYRYPSVQSYSEFYYSGPQGFEVYVDIPLAHRRAHDFRPDVRRYRGYYDPRYRPVPPHYWRQYPHHRHPDHRWRREWREDRREWREDRREWREDRREHRDRPRHHRHDD